MLPRVGLCFGFARCKPMRMVPGFLIGDAAELQTAGADHRITDRAIRRRSVRIFHVAIGPADNLEDLAEYALADLTRRGKACKMFSCGMSIANNRRTRACAVGSRLASLLVIGPGA